MCSRLQLQPPGHPPEEDIPEYDDPGNAEYLEEPAVKDATTTQVETAGMHALPKWNNGYRYQIWTRSVPGSYRFDGAWGQYCAVFPDKNLVGVTNSHTSLMEGLYGSIRDLIYKNL